ncbi:hypothetical protein TWF192_002368 [Orbilia oligospora]|uniref:Uncharacterized protein n=1 Tax=Orbilia oligospora TaxID=2813651 RepID=A0A6G1MES3_ORBOL|nr:hypothetical protein TWF679_006763 [Orbilia oligospora]KAF3229132.1 hypothetical protein TWF191_001685 [Orbilia oligospora]KAF3255936.1 hypothetical protein TWF192_002368 [Orbilia oligospora]
MVGLDAFFLLFAWLLLWTPSANANTEKIIFSVPDSPNSALESVIDGPKFNVIGLLSPAESPEKLLLRTELPRELPSESAPHGIDSWVHLKGLKPGARYEARICWAATAPSDFWLSVHSPLDYKYNSDVYLKISAIAAYYTTNATLMDRPEPVLVDIILDEFLLGVLPRSLLNVGLFIVIMAGVAWYAGSQVVQWLDVITKKGLKDKVA